jgi:hypothetical protein
VILVIAIALVVVGVPAALLKVIAGAVFAARQGVIGRSIGWGMGVGIAVIILHFMALDILRDLAPPTRELVLSLGGWTLTLIEAGFLALAAISLDYWMAVRPTALRLATFRMIGYLVVSNVWILGGGFLILQFNAMSLYPSCIDPVTEKIVDTFYEPRPDGCEDLSD